MFLPFLSNHWAIAIDEINKTSNSSCFRSERVIVSILGEVLHLSNSNIFLNILILQLYRKLCIISLSKKKTNQKTKPIKKIFASLRNKRGVIQLNLIIINQINTLLSIATTMTSIVTSRRYSLHYLHGKIWVIDDETLELELEILNFWALITLKAASLRAFSNGIWASTRSWRAFEEPRDDISSFLHRSRRCGISYLSAAR